MVKDTLTVAGLGLAIYLIVAAATPYEFSSGSVLAVFGVTVGVVAGQWLRRRRG